MITRSFENQIRDSITTMEITAKILFSPRLMPDVQYVYIQKFASCFLIFENPFIILKVSFLISSTPFIFIRTVFKLLLEY